MKRQSINQARAIARQTRVLLTLVVVICVGCASVDERSQETEKNYRMGFIDIASFDKSLEQRLEQGADTITIEFSQDFELNHVPDRVDRWLSSVSEHGGSIYLSERQQPNKDGAGDEAADALPKKGFIMDAFELVLRAGQRHRDNKRYKKIKGYSATVWHEKGSAKVIELKKQ